MQCPRAWVCPEEEATSSLILMVSVEDASLAVGLPSLVLPFART